MRVRQEQDGLELDLDEQPLGRGGEALIYGVSGQPELVAKIYHKPNAIRSKNKSSLFLQPDVISRW